MLQEVKQRSMSQRRRNGFDERRASWRHPEPEPNRKNAASQLSNHLFATFAYGQSPGDKPGRRIHGIRISSLPMVQAGDKRSFEVDGVNAVDLWGRQTRATVPHRRVVA